MPWNTKKRTKKKWCSLIKEAVYTMSQPTSGVSGCFKGFKLLSFFVRCFFDNFLSEISSNLLWSLMHVKVTHTDLALRYFLLILYEWKALRVFACVHLLKWRQKKQCESDLQGGFDPSKTDFDWPKNTQFCSLELKLRMCELVLLSK